NLQRTYVYDFVTATTTLISVGLAGAATDQPSFPATISDDGRYCAFQSSATNIVSGDTNGFADIFFKDLQAGTTEIAVYASNGSLANGSSPLPQMTPDARYISFVSFASNLVPNDTNGVGDFFVLDRSPGCNLLSQFPVSLHMPGVPTGGAHGDMDGD